VECGALCAGEVEIAAGQTADERELQHLGKPLPAQRRVTKELLEIRIEEPEVEQCLVDVEGDHAHDPDGNP
jgi:hypothetical protein